MITIRIFLIGLLTFASLAGRGQSDSLKSDYPGIRYFNNLMSGGLIGKNNVGSSLTFSTTHGVRYKTLSAGIGFGYDVYRDWNLVPVFGTVSYDFASIGNNKLFLQGSFGHSWARYANTLEGSPRYESDGGRMIQPALGYRINAQQWSLYFALGYRFQTISYTRTPIGWGLGWTVITDHVTQNMERLSVQIGFGLH